MCRETRTDCSGTGLCVALFGSVLRLTPAAAASFSMSHPHRYCSVSSANSWGDHLGWPKQVDDGTPPGAAPEGYGSGFAQLGLAPPAWDAGSERRDRLVDGATDGRAGAGPGDCGSTLRNGVLRTGGSGYAYALEPLMAAHSVDLYLCGYVPCCSVFGQVEILPKFWS